MRVAVIGVGKLGSIHLRIYKEIKGIRKIYIVDTNPTTLTAYPEIESFSNFKDLAGKVDLVSIASSTPTHFEISKFFLNQKIPVLVEKPLTENLNEAQQLISLARKKRTLLFVGHVERYNNAYLEAKKIIKNPLFIECHRLSVYPNRSLETSVVLDLMIHDLDIILDLVKDKIKRCEVKGVKVLSPTDDIANARVTFKKGCVADITASRISAKRERKIRIFLPHCYISMDYAEQNVEIYQRLKGNITREVLPISKEEPLKKEIMEFVNLARNKNFTMEHAEKAKDALMLALHIEKNLK
ncbi:MAG: Gfo/Idh/MocA family oxidoreductase [Candidatus Omnitrophota bacterium]|nr:MAG: Gfo/Idh/MocA family oxidoreductase [Candidatus Omnitrophota bacterium]